MKKILLIGGTGILGSCISEILKERNKDFEILIGSRKPTKATQIEIDVNDSKTFHYINQYAINLVVMCTTDPQNNVLQYCIDQGIDYLDTTKPNPQIIKSYKNFVNRATTSRIVFGSAWMGGVIPSIVKDTHSAETIESIKLYIYYSLEDKAGKSAADFMAENASSYFSIYTQNATKNVRHFEGVEKYDFSFVKTKGLKTTYFDIPDLYILHHIENIKNVVAKVAYSSNVTNTILSLLQKLNLFKLFSLRTRKNLFQSKGKGDITGFEILIEKSNKQKYRTSIVHQEGQAALTAFSTCLHIEQLLNGTIKKGLYFSHQLHEIGDYTNKLKENKYITIKHI